MTKYNALIVDDERLARSELKRMLEQFSRIQVVGEAADVLQAVELTNQLKPDVIFLDIQMPGESGFDFVEKHETDARIIFVTAYDEHAVRAFEVNALDYLLKPVSHERLAESIERLESGISAGQSPTSKLNINDRLFLLCDSKYKFIKIDSIKFISASGDFSEIQTTTGKYLTSKTMREWELRLPENTFVRIHRSTIINLDFVTDIDKWFNYSFRVRLEGVTEPLVISRRYASRIKREMG